MRFKFVNCSNAVTKEIISKDLDTGVMAILKNDGAVIAVGFGKTKGDAMLSAVKKYVEM